MRVFLPNVMICSETLLSSTRLLVVCVCCVSREAEQEKEGLARCAGISNQNERFYTATAAASADTCNL